MDAATSPAQPTDITFAGVAINIPQDLEAIAWQAWSPEPTWMLLPSKQKSDDWRADFCRLGARSTVDDSVSYLFEFARDRITGNMIGDPTLRVTLESDDYKPASEPVTEFGGIQARQMWEAVAAKFSPAKIGHEKNDLDSPMFGLDWD